MPTSVFRRTFSVADHRAGGVAFVKHPLPPPRQPTGRAAAAWEFGVATRAHDRHPPATPSEGP